MIALTAYGIRKAYKKQQAKKAHKEQLEREDQESTSVSLSDEFPRPVSGGLINYAPSTQSGFSQVKSASPSSRTTSIYSQTGGNDPLEDIRKYRAYIEQQSYDFMSDIGQSTHELAVEENVQHAWKSPFNLPARTEDPAQLRESRHIPQGPNRVVEIDSSSESTPVSPQKTTRRVFRPRNSTTSSNEIVSPVIELPADIPVYIGSSIDGHLQPPSNELDAEVPPSLRKRKSKEVERFQLPANEVTSLHAGAKEIVELPTGGKMVHVKRPRSESNSEIESEDSEVMIVRFNVGEKPKRSLPRRVPGPV